MAIDMRTPEAAHSDLIAAIQHEIATYGPASVAEVVAVLLEDWYGDEDEPNRPPEALIADQAARAFHALAAQLALRSRPLPLWKPGAPSA